MAVLTLPNAETMPLSIRAKALVFEDPESRALESVIQRVAPTNATVLITGETGTGKEIVARHLHALSRRHKQPFVAVNCGAFTESLAESELFGHERGAFTGATNAKVGWFEVAHGGTLFLDEIGDLSLPLQVKLLRVLQEREVVRLGSRQATPFDVRLIAATNVDLGAAVAAKHFREDLFYRLNVATLPVKPLRERPGDILPLARHFLHLHGERLGTGTAELTPAAAQRLVDHHWPGNIRELENVIHHALVVGRDGRIAADDLRFSSLPRRAVAAETPATAPDPTSELERALLALYEQNLPDLHTRIEEAVVRTAYRYCDRNQLQTARLLGISRNIVRARLLQFGEISGATRSARTDRKIGDELRNKLRIGHQTFGLLGLVKATGRLDAALEQHGFGAEWTEFPSGAPLVNALQAGRIDLGVVGEGPPILAQAADARIVYLAAEPPAPESEAIIVHDDSDIRSVADLKGRTVVLARGANVEYLLRRALEEAQIAYEDVHVSFVPPTGARAAFESREVDAWVIWNPLLASVTHATGARILRDGRGLARNVAWYVGARDFADERPELVSLFLEEVNAVGQWANQHAPAAARLLAAQLGMATEPVEAALRSSRFGLRPASAETLASLQEVADSFHRAKVISRAVSVADAQWNPP